MAIHDYIQRVLGEADEPSTWFSRSRPGSCVPESRMLISEQAERLAMSMIAWMAEKDAPPGAGDNHGSQ